MQQQSSFSEEINVDYVRSNLQTIWTQYLNPSLGDVQFPEIHIRQCLHSTLDVLHQSPALLTDSSQFTSFLIHAVLRFLAVPISVEVTVLVKKILCLCLNIISQENADLSADTVLFGMAQLIQEISKRKEEGASSSAFSVPFILRDNTKNASDSWTMSIKDSSSAVLFLTYLQEVLDECKKTLDLLFPWFWDSYTSASGGPNDTCQALYSAVAHSHNEEEPYRIPISLIDSKLLEQTPLTAPCDELLEAYIFKLDQETWILPEVSFSISLKFFDTYPELVCDLLIIVLSRMPVSPHTTNIVIKSPSSELESQCILQLSYPLPKEFASQLSFSFLPWFVSALVVSKHLLNVIPSLMYLIRNFDCEMVLRAFSIMGLYVDKNASLLILTTSIEVLNGLDEALVQPIEPWLSARKLDLTLPPIVPTQECYALAIHCINNFSNLNSDLPVEVSTWIARFAEAPFSSAFTLEELCQDFSLDSLSRFRSILLHVGHLEMKRLLHPFWKSLAIQISDWNEPSAQREAFQFLASLLDITLESLFISIKGILVPLALASPSIEACISPIFGKSIQSIAMTYSETWITWVLTNNPADTWSNQLSQVATAIFAQPYRGNSEICESGGYQLLVQLCLHRNVSALEWVAFVLKKSLLSLILEAALPLMMQLGDSIQKAPWTPGNPDPQDALVTMSWFISQLGADVAMIASQVLALLSSVAKDYPEAVCECWKVFIGAVDKDTLVHFWPSVLMTCIKKVSDRSCLHPFLDFLFKFCPKRLLPLLPDLPPGFATYQKLIKNAKNSIDLETRIQQVCTRILSTDIEVACASIEELNHLLMPLEDIPEAGRIIQSLLLAIKRHPLLKLKCADCLCTLGAVDTLSSPLDFKSEHALCDASVLPQKLVEECLLPSFRSSTNIVSQIFYAFTIQKICKFSAGMVHDLNDLDSATVRPLLKSRYRLELQGQPTYKFPIFASSMTLADWVCRLVLVLSDVCLQEPLKPILQATKLLLTKPEEACSLAIYLLPHIILHICLYQRDSMQLISDEFSNILKQTEHDSTAYPCAHTIFHTLSQLMDWIYQNKNSRRQSEPVQAFLKSTQLKYLASAAEMIGLYDTSLFYLESLSSPPSKLFEIYVKKGEMDYALGVSTLIGFKTPEHIALEHSISNDWALVQAVYGSSLAMDPTNLTKHLGLLNAMKELDLFSSVLSQCHGIVSDFPEWKEKLNHLSIEACWQLGQWEKLDDYVKESEPVTIGHLFLDLYEKKTDSFKLHAEKLKLDLLARFQLTQSASTLTNFHIVSDLTTYQENADQDWMVFGYPIWQRRIQRVRNTHECKDRILRVCRSMNLLSSQRTPQWNTLMGSLSLQSAKLSMKENRKHTAYSHLLNAKQHYQVLPIYYHVQMGKWLARYQNVQASLNYVKQFSSTKATLPNLVLNMISVCYDPNIKPGTDEYELSHLQLLSARWMDTTNDTDSDTILKTFHSACANQPSWDKPVYFMGRYTHKLANELKTQENESANVERFRLIDQTLKLYGRCLLLGTRYAYEAMLLLLDLWMDSAPNGPATSSVVQTFGSMHKYVLQLLQEVPAYSLLVALPQVTSRLCHKNKDVLSALTLFIVRCLNAAPSQSMWQFISSVLSADPNRAKRARDIIHVAKSESPSLGTLLTQIQTLSELLIQVSNLAVAKDLTHFTLSSRCPQLLRLHQLDRVVLPMQAFLRSPLPDLHRHSKSASSQETQVYFHSFSDRVEIMSSLVRPKKLEVTGSDGIVYTFLCKPKDDLRKDARLLELSGFINRLLKKKRTTRERNLRIRTYSVTPLSEDCGLIEWIPKTTAMRALLRPMYASRNIDIFNREIQQIFREPTEKLHANFQLLLKKCPPLLHIWFAQSFPGPKAWFQARLNFTRTCAVMSMVGYILGLGDRHCENILLDIDSGDLIHVDFNCLFEKGKTLAKPEIVPFRLTQNVVAAFGTGGLEVSSDTSTGVTSRIGGPFKEACKVTLELLRENSESLMIVLESFLHDPLIEWKSKKKAHTELSEDQMRNQAQVILKRIEDRLQGIVEHGSPLSVSGQVSELIRQATSSEALSRMYEGWLPHI